MALVIWRMLFKMKNSSIDREENDGDYTFNNCQFMELGDNVRKGFADRKAKVMCNG